MDSGVRRLAEEMASLADLDLYGTAVGGYAREEPETGFADARKRRWRLRRCPLVGKVN